MLIMLCLVSSNWLQEGQAAQRAICDATLIDCQQRAIAGATEAMLARQQEPILVLRELLKADRALPRLPLLVGAGIMCINGLQPHARGRTWGACTAQGGCLRGTSRCDESSVYLGAGTSQHIACCGRAGELQAEGLGTSSIQPHAGGRSWAPAR